jgi:sphingomyelin phosphodiesterase
LSDQFRYLADQFSWNYNHVASLWLNEQWLTEDESQKARTHYGGFAAFTKDGLKVISVNTDWWYTANKYNYINMTDPDSSGTLKWLADELQQG